MTNSTKINLSKNLLEMKFMKKSKEKVENEKSVNEQKILFDGEVTESMRRLGMQYIVEPSYVSCMDLVSGRMSFRGANPEIEQMMREIEILKQESERDERETKGTISADEMAERYSTLIGTIGKKFRTKRQRTTAPVVSDQNLNEKEKEKKIVQPVTKKRKRFMKPVDE